MDNKKLVLVDGHSILNRAFYGMPDLTNAAGLHTGAVFGFLNILFKILDEENADYLTVAFDVHAPTFRHEAYKAYKGTRRPMPEELREQVTLVKKVLRSMGIQIREQAGQMSYAGDYADVSAIKQIADELNCSYNTARMILNNSIKIIAGGVDKDLVGVAKLSELIVH